MPAEGHKASLPRLLGLGVLAALFFSSTFVLNRAMSLAGGHWAWSASLRFFYLVPMLALLLLVTGGPASLLATWRAFWRHAAFWVVAGSIGFGVFYAFITFASNSAPGWIVATTWQTTILATPLVLMLFGKKVPARGVAFSLLIFIGIVLVNAEALARSSLAAMLMGALPVLVSAFAYPFGNQLVWEATQGSQAAEPEAAGASGTASASGTAATSISLSSTSPSLVTPKPGYAKSFLERGIPHLGDDAPKPPFARVLLLTVGSLPFWLLLLAITRPPAPSAGQATSTALVALFSGVVATSLFLYARNLGRQPYEIAAVDSTQAMEMVFSLAGEVLFLGAALPGPLGWAGVALTVLGLCAYMFAQGR